MSSRQKRRTKGGYLANKRRSFHSPPGLHEPIVTQSQSGKSTTSPASFSCLSVLSIPSQAMMLLISSPNNFSILARSTEDCLPTTVNSKQSRSVKEGFALEMRWLDPCFRRQYGWRNPAAAASGTDLVRTPFKSGHPWTVWVGSRGH